MAKQSDIRLLNYIAFSMNQQLKNKTFCAVSIDFSLAVIQQVTL